MLILSNKTPKLLVCWLVLLGGPSLYLRSSKTEKWRFFENFEKSQNEQFFDNFWKSHFDVTCTHIDINYLILQNFLNIIWDNFWQKFRSKFLPLRPEQLNFYLWCRCYSDIDKTNNLWQRKQQVLLWSNMTPRVLQTEIVVRGGRIAHFFLKKI